MLTKRIIPVLLIHKGLLYKTIKFKDPRYVGDPINAVRIFNEKEVDEIAILDIDASRLNRMPDFKMIQEIAGEAFMPLAYGGGITSTDQVKRIIDQGVEKVIFNTASANLDIISNCAAQIGSSSTVVSIDVKKNFFGSYQAYAQNGTRPVGKDPVDWAKAVEQAGAGEIVIHSIDRDGTMSGYDTTLIQKVCAAVSVPVIACGGAGNLNDLDAAFKAGASAAAAGSLFVFHGKHKAVLITYPDEIEKSSIIHE